MSENTPLIPTFTQIPNYVLDFVMPTLTGAEFKVLAYIMRRTYGFSKLSDTISLSQLEHGIKCADGTILDAGTGLSKPTICAALTVLTDRGLVLKKQNFAQDGGSAPTAFTLNLQATGGLNNLTGGVKELNTQKKVLQNKENTIAHVSKSLTPKTVGGGPDFTEDFTKTLWLPHPKKSDKKAALKAAGKLTPPDFIAMRAAFPKWLAHWQCMADAGDAVFIPNLATWLNGERWKEELPPCKIARSKPLSGTDTSDRPKYGRSATSPVSGAENATPLVENKQSAITPKANSVPKFPAYLSPLDILSWDECDQWRNATNPEDAPTHIKQQLRYGTDENDD